METADVIKKVRKLEIKAKGLTNQLFSGEYHSAFRGKGMSFSEVRAYQYGDDIRNIDWNVTARTGDPFVKVFEEERELTVMLLIDVSASSYFGTQSGLKSEVATEIAALLAFSAVSNNDRIGAILFSDKIEKSIPPQKGRKILLRIIRELIQFQPASKGTNVSLALDYLLNTQKKRCIAFLLSDFITPDFAKSLLLSAKKHDLTGIHIHDAFEKRLPDVGMIYARDAENGQARYIDTSDSSVVGQVYQNYNSRVQAISSQFSATGADLISIQGGEEYVGVLHSFFKKRAKRR
jgi:uncharacterized protein (DUF58 family)